MNNCQFCLESFGTPQSLNIHYSKALYCTKYKNVLFSCQLCGFDTKGIRNIENHTKNCTDEKIEINTDKNKEIQRLQSLLEIETIKNKIWCKLLQDNTNIKINDIIVQEDNIIHIYDNINNDLSIIVHNNSSNIIKIEENDMKDNTVQKKQNYRSIKGCIDIQDIEAQVISNEEKIDLLINYELDKFDIVEEATYNINAIFTKIKQSRVYTKLLDELRIQRLKIIGRMHIDEYINLLLDHIKQLNEFFTDKRYSDKKIKQTIAKSLSSIENRILMYDIKNSLYLEADDVELLFTVLKLGITHSKNYIPYNSQELCNRFNNYGIVLFPIQKLLDIFVINPYVYNNIIYLPLVKSMDTDPYSFYVLERVNKEKKYWNMDCRLEEVSTNMVNNLLPFTVKMFRLIYKNIFDDNDFRVKYNDKSQITELDCEQLLQTILLLSKPKQFCLILQEKIRNSCIYKPTDNDKFNLYADDPLQCKHFHKKEEDAVDIIRQLFDNITTEQMVDFYRSRLV